MRVIPYPTPLPLKRWRSRPPAGVIQRSLPKTWRPALPSISGNFRRWPGRESELGLPPCWYPCCWHALTCSGASDQRGKNKLPAQRSREELKGIAPAGFFASASGQREAQTRPFRQILGRVPIQVVLRTEQGSHQGCPYHSGPRTTWNGTLPTSPPRWRRGYSMLHSRRTATPPGTSA